jgi:small subunit ribosomal protein S8
MKVAIAEVLKQEGYIKDFSVATEEGKTQPTLKLELSYGGRRQPILSGLKRVSKPGLRVYVQRREIPRVYGGLGVAILSTPKGIMTGREARRQEVGGEVLCYVW